MVAALFTPPCFFEDAFFGLITMGDACVEHLPPGTSDLWDVYVLPSVHRKV